MVKKILIAEDDEDIRYILNLALKQAGYEVEPLASGDSIVKRKHQWPDLFILDKALPVIDGIAISKYLKINKETREIPIIMISCYHKLKAKASEFGVDAFIEKPFELKLLLQEVEKQLETRN